MNTIPFTSISKFYLEAQTVYSAHSPFVYKFMKDVMGEMKQIDLHKDIERKRKELIQSRDKIKFVEYGAGSAYGNNGAQRDVSNIAKNSLSGRWQCRILHNIIQTYGIANVLELGTSLGISTAYLALANKNGKVVTLEGNPSSLDIARRVWKDLSIQNITAHVGEFGKTLPDCIADMDRLGMVFLDGNHRKVATLDYFDQIKHKLSKASIVIVDDIYWSKDMHEAWNIIRKDEEVAFSIDLFRMGILFFDHDIMRKQHFKLIPYKFKPWAIGLFG